MLLYPYVSMTGITCNYVLTFIIQAYKQVINSKSDTLHKKKGRDFDWSAEVFWNKEIHEQWQFFEFFDI